MAFNLFPRGLGFGDKILHQPEKRIYQLETNHPALYIRKNHSRKGRLFCPCAKDGMGGTYG